MFIDLDNNIAGYSSPWTLNIIGREAMRVKPNGWIVEIGSFCGRSTYVLGKNKHDSVKLTCIDTWPDSPVPVPNNDFIFGNVNSCFNYTEFVNNTSMINNLETLRCVLPLKVSNLYFSNVIDLLFLDLYPDHDLCLDQLFYWSKFMSGGSKIVVNDYESNHAAIEEFCSVSELTPVNDINIAIIGL